MEDTALRTNEGRSLDPRARVWLLGLLGALSFTAYWVFVSMALNPKLSLAFNVKGAEYGGPLTWPSRWLHLAGISDDLRTRLFIFLMAALSLMWLGAIYLVRKDNRRSLALIIVAAFGAFALLFVFGPSFLSRDVFSYSFYGRSMSVYHSNPYLLVPAARQHDILYPLAGWKNNASAYGPVFNYLSFAITRLAGDNIAANVLGFKLLAFLSYAACLPLVYSLARRVSPGKENMALAISAWCPVLVIHFLGAGHNDALMVALLLGGYLLYRKGYLLPGIAVVLLAVMVKVVAVLALVPLLLLYVRDKRGVPLKRLLEAGTMVIVVPLVLYLPFLHGLEIFKTTARMSKLYSKSSVPSLLSLEYKKLLTHGGMAATKATQVANARVQLFFLVVFAIAAIVLLSKVKNYRSMVACSASLCLAWFLTSSYVLPWYLAMGLMLAAVAGWNLTTATLIGASAVFSLWRMPKPSTGGYHGEATLYIALPFLLLLLGWFTISTVRWLAANKVVTGRPFRTGTR